LAILNNEAATTGVIALGAVLASGALLGVLLTELDKVGISEKDKVKIENAFLEASIIALPISPVAFAIPAAKGTADKLGKWLNKTITRLEKEGKIIT